MTTSAPDSHSPLVAVAHGYFGYSEVPPFSPAELYPEYPFPKAALSPGRNPAYAAVREALQLLAFDSGRIGTRDWNPLRVIIEPGQTVVVKPNFVRQFRESSPDHANCLVTHGAIVRAAVDYIFLALDGRGRIVIADAPQNDADFGALRRIAGLDALQAFYRRCAGFEVEVYDLRQERAHKIEGVIVGHEPLPGDPRGYVTVNLASQSAFADIDALSSRLYGAEYDTAELHQHHCGGIHEYLISRSVLEADAVIGLPKLKTHKKVGLTACMKNLVGINGNKNWLPHYRIGTAAEGGDEFAKDGARQRWERHAVAQFKRLFPHLGRMRAVVARPIKRLGQRIFGDTNHGTIRSGNWHGNDTAWRMVHDLCRVLLYADVSGVLHEHRMRRFFNIVDAIIAGEGDGPLDPTARALGAVLAGFDPVAVDSTCARLAGFDYREIPMLAQATRAHRFPLTLAAHPDFRCVSTDQARCGPVCQLLPWGVPWSAPLGWQRARGPGAHEGPRTAHGSEAACV